MIIIIYVSVTIKDTRNIGGTNILLHNYSIVSQTEWLCPKYLQIRIKEEVKFPKVTFASEDDESQAQNAKLSKSRS